MSLPMGVQVPIFYAASPGHPNFAFDSVGGRYSVLAFLPPPSPERDAALALVAERAKLFNDARIVLFGVLPDAASFGAVENTPNRIRWFEDSAGHVRSLFQAVDETGALAPQWVVIDPSMRILATAPLGEGPWVMNLLATLGEPDAHAGVDLVAPILIVPRILEPGFCRALIEAYENEGGVRSGVMREVDGKTVPVLDDFKRRRDAEIPDGPLRGGLNGRIVRRLLPEIEKAFFFKATRIERYIVSCYNADEGGYFLPHRDNTTAGTAHRRFAVTINLNAEEFDGGDLRFPEFSARTYRAPTGGAVVFSCSLLHEATAVTRGRRYATLPFLYDEAAAQIREANRGALAV